MTRRSRVPQKNGDHDDDDADENEDVEIVQHSRKGRSGHLPKIALSDSDE